jgi:hypothetical protein
MIADVTFEKGKNLRKSPIPSPFDEPISCGDIIALDRAADTQSRAN